MDALQDKLACLTINSTELFLLELDNTLEEKFPVVYTDSKNILALGINHGAFVVVATDVENHTIAYIKILSSSTRRSNHVFGIVNEALIRNLFENHFSNQKFMAAVYSPESLEFFPGRRILKFNVEMPRIYYPLWFSSSESKFFVDNLQKTNLRIHSRTNTCLDAYRKPVFCSCEITSVTGDANSNNSTEPISRIISEINEAKMLNSIEDKFIKRLCIKLKCFGLWKFKTPGNINVPPNFRRATPINNHFGASMESLSDVGGYAEVKILLLEAINSVVKPSCTKFGIEPVKGILLYGPPGCSKTLIAKTISAKAGMNFFSIKGPEIFSKWVGDSEKRLKEVFLEARRNEPSVIFIDEIDSIAKKRGASGSSVDVRVLSQLLTDIDGIHSHSGNFIVIGATNRPDILDAALLRPGRLDKHIYVPLPSKKSVQEIIRILKTRFCISSEVDTVNLSANLQGFSGAEIVSIFQDAAYISLSENNKEITQAIIEKAMGDRLPGTHPDLLRYYEEFQVHHSINADY